MKNPFKHQIDGCFPTPGQESLIRACVTQGQVAADAYQAWRKQVDFEDLDYGSFRLLALLFTKIPPDFEDPIVPRLKGIYRYSWVRNRRALHNLSKLLEKLDAAGIRSMLIKGASLALDVYQDYGVRYMDDCDILVPWDRAEDAIQILRSQDFQQTCGSPKVFKTFGHGCNFVGPQGLGVDLHWHLLPHCCNDEDNADFWKHARPYQLEGVSTHLPDPADELLSTCVNGMRWSGVSTIRWVADSMLLIRRHPDLNWERLADQAERLRLTLYLGGTLDYLVRVFDAPIPKNILERIKGQAVPNWQHREYRSDRRPRRWLDEFPILWHRYHRTAMAGRYRLKPLGFLRFLQEYCGLEQPWEVPLFLMKRFLPKVRKNIAIASP